VALSLATLLLLNLLNLAVTQAQEVPRHTPGFPESSLEGLTPFLSEWQKILNMLSNATLSDVLSNASAKEELQNYVKELEAENKLTLEEREALKATLSGDVSVDELMKNIRSENLRNVLNELLNMSKEGLLKSEDLMKYLSMVAKMREEGYISISDYISALNIMKTLTRDEGVLTAIDSELLKSMINLLASAGSTPEFTALPSIPSGSLSLSLKTPEVGSTSRYLEGFKIPSISVAFPSLSSLVLQDVLQYVVLAIVLIVVFSLGFLFIRRFREPIARAFSKAVLSRGEVGLEGLPEPIKYYWSSVKAVETYTKIRKLDNVTHREYLSRVSQSLGDLVEEFKKVTQAYELVRFGGSVSDEVVKEAKESYVRLVRRL